MSEERTRFNDKKLNMSYWDLIDETTENYIKDMLLLGDVKYKEEYYSDLLPLMKEISKIATEYLSKCGATYPYIDENY